VRGDVYELRSDRRAAGQEQRGPRYCVILQADYLPLSTVVVVPTSSSAAAADFRPEITVRGQRTRALPEQVMTFDAGRLGQRVGQVTSEELDDIGRALLDVVDL
jgi:mRNA interferase MazF